MRFEPDDYLTPAEPPEIPLFRVMISHRPVLHFLFLAILFYVGHLLASAYLADSDPNTPALLLLLLARSLFLTLFVLALLTYMFTRIELTDRRLHGRKFTIPRHHFDLPLQQLRKVSVLNPLLAGRLRYGLLLLTDRRGRRYYIPFVREPLQVKKTLDRYIP